MYFHFRTFDEILQPLQVLFFSAARSLGFKNAVLSPLVSRVRWLYRVCLVPTQTVSKGAFLKLTIETEGYGSWSDPRWMRISRRGSGPAWVSTPPRRNSFLRAALPDRRVKLPGFLAEVPPSGVGAPTEVRGLLLRQDILSRQVLRLELHCSYRERNSCRLE